MLIQKIVKAPIYYATTKNKLRLQSASTQMISGAAKLDVKKADAVYELVGVLLGDGYIFYKPPRYRIEISGNSTEDLPYLQSYLSVLRQNIVDKEIHLTRHHDKKGNSIRLIVYSKKLVTYLVDEIGLIYGRRKAELAEVQDKFLNVEWGKTKLILRGFAYADGSLFFGRKGTYEKHLYPTIEMRSASPKLLRQFKTFLQRNGFAPRLRSTKSSYKSKASFLYLSGKKQLLKWVNEIGFSNLKHLTK